MKSIYYEWKLNVFWCMFYLYQWYAFEFVVMCTGKYGDIPNIPNFPHKKGPEVFKGKVLHTLDYAKLDQEASTRLMKGKKVVVVGYKKSAIDLAVECAEANQGKTLSSFIISNSNNINIILIINLVLYFCLLIKMHKLYICSRAIEYLICVKTVYDNIKWDCPTSRRQFGMLYI